MSLVLFLNLLCNCNIYVVISIVLLWQKLTIGSYWQLNTNALKTIVYYLLSTQDNNSEKGFIILSTDKTTEAEEGVLSYVIIIINWYCRIVRRA